MKLLHRYFLIHFFKPFIFGLNSFIIIMTVSELFEYLDTFTGMKAQLRDVLLYLIYQIPDWTVQVMPVAVLLGCLFSLNNLLLKGEITAVKASGISMKNILYPYLGFGCIITLCTIVFSETIIPLCNKQANHIYTVHIRKLPANYDTQWDKLVLSGKDNIRISAEQFFVDRGYIKRVVVDQFADMILVRQIDAREAQWTGNAWKFKQGVERIFSDNGKYIAQETFFDEKIIDISNTPQDLAPQRMKSDEMNLAQLSAYIKHLTKIGISTTAEKVKLHMKISFPFANIIILFIGIPFGLHAKKGSGKLVSFAFALLVAFTYWGMISVGQSLGNARILPAWLAAWFANIIFGILGIIFFNKIHT